MFRFHLPSLPHTQTTSEYSWCAYSSKVRKFADMMMALGHEVFLYGGEQNEANCTEFISCLSEDERKGYFGDVIPEFDSDHPGWSQFNETAIYEIGKRKQPGDFLTLIGGTTQKPIADAHPDLMTVEFGIGYSGVFAQFKVFESYAWMHAVYGERTGASNSDGAWYDEVIPNYWDVNEFPLGNGAGGYLLYIGRLIERKGVQVAVQLAKATGKKLVVAGSGSYKPWTKYDDVQYVGSVGPRERGLLMGNAIATLVPTSYLEPFGGVSVESMLTGTPAITTDWGAFPENIPAHYRCRNLQQFITAVRMAEAENNLETRRTRRDAAQRRWSMDVVRHQYQDYFDRLSHLYGGGWYQQAVTDEVAQEAVPFALA